MLFHKHLTIIFSPSCASSVRKLLKPEIGVLCSNRMVKSLRTSETQYKDENLEACFRLAKILDISENQAMSIGKRVPRVLSRDVDNIIQIVNTLKKYGLLEAAKTTHPILLCQKATVFENYLLILKESGINTSPDKPLVGKRYRSFKSKIIQQLKPDPIPYSFDVVRNYIKVLDFDEDTANKLHGHLPSKPESLTLERLRSRVIEFYISKAWDCSSRASKDIVRGKPGITKRSLAWIRELTEILQTEFHVSSKMPSVYPGLLNECDPQKLFELAEEAKSRVKVPLESLFITNPKLLRSSAKNLLESESVFMNHGCSPPDLSKFLRICVVSPETVESRLMGIKANPELEHYMKHARLPDVVCYYNLFKRRIDSS